MSEQCLPMATPLKDIGTVKKVVLGFIAGCFAFVVAIPLGVFCFPLWVLMAAPVAFPLLMGLMRQSEGECPWCRTAVIATGTGMFQRQEFQGGKTCRGCKKPLMVADGYVYPIP